MSPVEKKDCLPIRLFRFLKSVRGKRGLVSLRPCAPSSLPTLEECPAIPLPGPRSGVQDSRHCPTWFSQHPHGRQCYRNEARQGKGRRQEEEEKSSNLPTAMLQHGPRTRASDPKLGLSARLTIIHSPSPPGPDPAAEITN